MLNESIPQTGAYCLSRAAELVIGYGNELRGDDGAGVMVARRLTGRLDSSSLNRVIATHQLTPDLAEDIAAATRVIFVDAYPASSGDDLLRVEKIHGMTDAEHGLSMVHRADPSSLLDLSRRLFGGTPEAWVVGIPAYRFDLGCPLSPETERGVDEAVARIAGKEF